MAAKRRRSGRSDDSDGKVSHDDDPEWLTDTIADLLLAEGEGLTNVANHLACSPRDPLPPDLFLVLRAWLQERHNVRITRVGTRGREPSEWLYLAERLTGAGFSIVEACRQAKKYLGLEMDEETLVREFRRYRKTKGADPVRGVGEAIVHEQRAKFLKNHKKLGSPRDK